MKLSRGPLRTIASSLTLSLLTVSATALAQTAPGGAPAPQPVSVAAQPAPVAVPPVAVQPVPVAAQPAAPPAVQTPAPVAPAPVQAPAQPAPQPPPAAQATVAYPAAGTPNYGVASGQQAEPYYDEERPRRSRRGRARHYVPGQPLAPGMLPPPVYRYTEGTPIPAGYHLEERVNRGLVRGGTLTFGLPYFASAMVGLSSGARGSQGWLLVPVAGPWIALNARRTHCNEIGDPSNSGSGCFADEAGAGLLIADGVLQALGAALITWGVIATQDYVVLDDVRVRIDPTQFDEGSYGLSLSGKF